MASNKRLGLGPGGRPFRYTGKTDDTKSLISFSTEQYRGVYSAFGRAGAATKKGLAADAAALVNRGRSLSYQLEQMNRITAEDAASAIAMEAYVRSPNAKKYNRRVTNRLRRAILDERNISYAPSGFEVMRPPWLNSVTNGSDSSRVKDYWDVIDRGIGGYTTTGYWLISRKGTARTWGTWKRQRRQSGAPIHKGADGWMEGTRPSLGLRLYQARIKSKSNFSITVRPVAGKGYIQKALENMRDGEHKGLRNIWRARLEAIMKDFLDVLAKPDGSQRYIEKGVGKAVGGQLQPQPETRIRQTFDSKKLGGDTKAQKESRREQIKLSKKAAKSKKPAKEARVEAARDAKPEDMDFSTNRAKESHSDRTYERARRTVEARYSTKERGFVYQRGTYEIQRAPLGRRTRTLKYTNERFFKNLPKGLTKTEQMNEALRREIEDEIRQIQEEAIENARRMAQQAGAGQSDKQAERRAESGNITQEEALKIKKRNKRKRAEEGFGLF